MNKYRENQHFKCLAKNMLKFQFEIVDPTLYSILEKERIVFAQFCNDGAKQQK